VTAHLVIDPYNDFISEGGKFWSHLKAVAEANQWVPHMLEVLNAARGKSRDTELTRGRVARSVG
jgi:hypothetical protein